MAARQIWEAVDVARGNEVTLTWHARGDALAAPVTLHMSNDDRGCAIGIDLTWSEVDQLTAALNAIRGEGE